MMYKLGKTFFYCIFAYLCRWKVAGADNLPSTGPVVVISNHLSLWDPLVVGSAMKRKVYFMAKEELFHYPLVGCMIRSWGAFPVKRGHTDRKALKNAMEVLRSGHVLGIFPEGTRSTTGKLQDFKSGAVSLAVKFGAPILPVGLIGTKNIFSKGRFHSFRVNIGKPIPTEKYASDRTKPEIIDELNRKVWEEVAKLAGQL